MPPNLCLIYPYCEKCKLARCCCICLRYQVFLAIQRENENEENRRREEERQRRIEEYRSENQRRLEEFHQTQLVKLKELNLQVEQIEKESNQLDGERDSLIQMKANVLKIIESQPNDEIIEKSQKIIEKIQAEIVKKEQILTNLANQLENCKLIEKLIIQKYELLRDEYERQFEEFKRQVLNQN